MEVEVNIQLPFLVVLDHQNGPAKTTVNRKPNYTFQYLHFKSDCKLEVVKGLYDRATWYARKQKVELRNLMISQKPSMKMDIPETYLRFLKKQVI